MPLCYVYTNLPTVAVKEGIEERFAKVVATTLAKPMERLIVIVVPDARIFRLESSDPACTVKISAIGVFDDERNPKYGTPIREFLVKELGVLGDRVTILYDDIKFSQIG